MPSKTDSTEAIREEIAARVMERYAEIQGLESSEIELSATLSALSDITNIPLAEVESIARDVQAQYATQPVDKSTNPQSVSKKPVNSVISFERLSPKDEARATRFYYHLVPYCAVCGVLVYLNIYSTSFPWAMFPILGWGIGLISHYISAIRAPRNALNARVRLAREQVEAILIENWPGFSIHQRMADYNGIYRLTITRSPKDTIEKYLKNCDSSLSQESISKISAQLIAIQSEIESGLVTDSTDLDLDFRERRGRGKRKQRYFKHRGY